MSKQFSVLHISGDYPDVFRPEKTKAIFNLLNHTRNGLEHQIVSINRVSPFGNFTRQTFDDANGRGHIALCYNAFPKGVRLAHGLEYVASRIIQDRNDRGLPRPDFIHAHKLSIEGLVGARLSEYFGRPLVVSIQGNSDLKIVGFKRSLRRRYRQIWQQSAAVFPFAPWTNGDLTRLLGARDKPTVHLPCPGADKTPFLSPVEQGPCVRTAFHLDHFKSKNIETLMRAIARLVPKYPEIRLGVAGSGSARATNWIKAKADVILPGRVEFTGALQNRDMPAYFNQAAVCALVSRRETFGMIYSEALRAGTPCLYSKGRAIAGYFPDGSIISEADPNSVADVATKLDHMIEAEREFKARLLEMQRQGAIDFLNADSIAQSYVHALKAI